MYTFYSLLTRWFAFLAVFWPGYPIWDLIVVSCLREVLSKGEEISYAVENETDYYNACSVYEVIFGIIFKGWLDHLENDHKDARTDVEKYERCVVVVELET